MMCRRIVAYLVVLSISLGFGLSHRLARAQQPAAASSIDLQTVIEATLAQSPIIESQRHQLRSSEGVLWASAGQFDPQMQVSVAGSRQDNLLATEPDVVTSTTTDVARYRLGLYKQFRSGLIVQPSLEMSRTNTAASLLDPANRTSANLAVIYPLLRGRGAETTAAAERAARVDYQAGKLDLRTTIAETAYLTARAYWQYVAAQEILAIAQESEDRAARMVDESRTLVEADERPTADLEQLLANLADKTARRIEQQQAFLEARQNLGLTMGLPPEQTVALPPPQDRFPEVNDEILRQLPATTVLIEAAFAQRTELEAAQMRRQSAGILSKATHNRLKPQLDLNLNLGYVGLGQGSDVGQFLTPFGPDAGGMNMSVSLGYSLPIRNQSAHGLAAQQEALLQQRHIAIDDLRRAVSINVETAVQALQSSVLQLQKSREAVGLYQTVVANERKKFQLEMATLFDVILAEDRRTGAQTTYILSQLRYAEALSRLRFETGTLLTFAGMQPSVEPHRLMTLPGRADLNR